MAPNWSRDVLSLPLGTAIVTLAMATGVSLSRDFGIFLIGYFGVIVLFGLSIALLLAAKINGSSFQQLAPPFLLVLCVPIAAWISFHHRDQILFSFWAPFHFNQLRDLEMKDDVIAVWDSWGIAGMENDSYLVSNANDSLNSLSAANQWALKRGQTCEVVAIERVWAKLYLLTTYNCPFSEIPYGANPNGYKASRSKP